jgi:hypothetical protein
MSTNQVYGHTAPTKLALSHAAVISEAVRAAANRLGVGAYLADAVALTEQIFGRQQISCQWRAAGAAGAA